MSIGDAQWAEAAHLVEVQLAGLGINTGDGEPIMVLSVTGGQQSLPISIGRAEALAIALHIEGVRPPRPLTHDLIAQLLAQLGHEVAAISVVDFIDGTFYGQLTLVDGTSVTCRPSDGVAIAVRVGCPLYVARDVLAQLGVATQDVIRIDAADMPVGDGEAEVARFRRFLDDVEPEDFDLSES